jgi:hypothetical protein
MDVEQTTNREVLEQTLKNYEEFGAGEWRDMEDVSADQMNIVEQLLAQMSDKDLDAPATESVTYNLAPLPKQLNKIADAYYKACEELQRFNYLSDPKQLISIIEEEIKEEEKERQDEMNH